MQRISRRHLSSSLSALIPPVWQRDRARNSVQDLSAVSENILLAAHAMGLGACWTTIYPIQKKVNGISRTLNLPGNLIPLNGIIIGYPDEPEQPKDKWDTKKITYGIPN